MNVTIFNLKITLDLCLEEHKCLELRHVCGHYRFVAVYLPDFPKDEEYTFSCSIATLINVGMGIFSFFCALVTFVTIGAYCRRSRQQAMYDTIENLNVRSNERGSVRFQAAPARFLLHQTNNLKRHQQLPNIYFLLHLPLLSKFIFLLTSPYLEI